MKATEVMLCWNPGTSEVALIRWPDTARLSAAYQCSALASYIETHEMSKKERKMMVFITAMHLIVRDKCDPMAVHQALLGLEEYVDGCADDMPGVAALRPHD